MFRGCGSSRAFMSFMGLVIFFIKALLDLFIYMDDSFSFDIEGNILWYNPYQCYYLAKQTKLLYLWDEIRLPHKKVKQEYGCQLRIMGFMVDPNEMQITMDDEDKKKLLDHVTDFMQTALGSTRRMLCEFQQLVGYINWSLNVFPHLKLALSNVYQKISRKSEGHASIFVNKAVVEDLHWFQAHVEVSSGVCVFEAMDWGIENADLTAYSDASALGMGFYFVEGSVGFQSHLLHDPPKDVIFYFEALTVLCVLE
jgi:hypothetical protein